MPCIIEKQLKSIVTEEKTMSAKKLQSLTKNDLIEKCKVLNLNTFGTKFDMVQRIMASEKTGVLNDIKHSIPPITVHMDPATGKYIHTQTSFVFDPQEKRVIAKMEKDGTLRDLQYEDIKVCMKYKFRYTLPENLAIETKVSSRHSTVKDTVHKDELLERRLQEIQEETSTSVDDDEEEEDDEEGDDDTDHC